MIINSSFYDYYDCVQRQYGYDPQDSRYVRERQDVEQDKNANRFGFSNVWPRFIGFCGNIYPITHFSDYESTSCREIFCYSLEEVDRYYTSRSKIDQETYFRIWGHRKKYRDFFAEENINALNRNYRRVFEQYKVPIFAKYGDRIVLNERLNQFEFYRVKPVNQAFQEVMMWINNLAAPEKPIPHIDDITMAQAKGFDKFSFRKEKKNKYGNDTRTA